MVDRPRSSNVETTVETTVGMTMNSSVFGYGSLVNRPHMEDYLQRDLSGPDSFSIASLAGFRRAWNVSTDNTNTREGYKYFTTTDGNRAPYHVTFLGIYRSSSEAINGVLFPVDADELARLDLRERNYTRIDVTAAVRRSSPPAEQVSNDHRIWTYLPSTETVERTQRALENGNSAVSAAYLRLVLSGFAGFGEPEVERYHASTDPVHHHVVELTRIDT